MSTKKKQNKKKKLGSLILLLFLTVIMLATSTYAWFTANRTVKISDIDVSVAASSGLQISTDAADWKTILNSEDLKAGYSVNGTVDTNQMPSTMVPVSTVGAVTDHRVDMFRGKVEANETTGVLELNATKCNAETKAVTGDFMAFDIFLKLDQAADVYLEKGSGVVGTNPADKEKGLQNAARYAFLVQGNAVATADQSTLVALNNGTASNLTIFEPNYDSHTAYGVTQSNSYYIKNTNYNAISAGDGNPAVSYDGVKAEISRGIELVKTNATDNSTYFGAVTPVLRDTNFSNGTADSNYKVFTNMSAGVTKIRVYFWVEGQDVDCENNASGSDLLLNLSFTLNDGASA